jgi:GNAT superfamily N-acetyltransferase
MTHYVRHATVADLNEVLDLYRHLSPGDPPPEGPKAEQAWLAILNCPIMHLLVVEADGILVSTCTLTVVPNLTRAARPYALIENVVTHADHRGRGYGTAALKAALNQAWEDGAYKVMLATGSTRESTIRFYEAAGFTKGGKTFFQARPA